MKYLKYVGLYFVMIAIGYNVLKMTEADKVWIALFFWRSSSLVYGKYVGKRFLTNYQTYVIM